MFKIIVLCLAVASTWASSHHPEQFLSELKNDPHATEKIYQQFCANCHAKNPLIPVGAPIVGNEADWKPRIKKGLPCLLNSTMNGIGIMPARGGCFECSDEQLTMIINYMTNQ